MRAFKAVGVLRGSFYLNGVCMASRRNYSGQATRFHLS
jgi:hypothetical protein